MSEQHPYPRIVDPRPWCIKCGDYVANENGVGSLCPVCLDEMRQARKRDGNGAQHSAERGSGHQSDVDGLRYGRDAAGTCTVCGSTEAQMHARTCRHYNGAFTVVADVSYQILQEETDAEGTRIIRDVRLLDAGFTTSPLVEVELTAVPDRDTAPPGMVALYNPAHDEPVGYLCTQDSEQPHSHCPHMDCPDCPGVCREWRHSEAVAGRCDPLVVRNSSVADCECRRTEDCSTPNRCDNRLGIEAPVARQAAVLGQQMGQGFAAGIEEGSQNPLHPHRWCVRTCRRYVTMLDSDCECGGAERAYRAWHAEQERQADSRMIDNAVRAAGFGLPVADSNVDAIDRGLADLALHEALEADRHLGLIRCGSDQGHAAHTWFPHADDRTAECDGHAFAVNGVELIAVGNEHWAHQPVGTSHRCRCEIGADHNQDPTDITDD